LRSNVLIAAISIYDKIAAIKKTDCCNQKQIAVIKKKQIAALPRSGGSQ